jgi:hypothetical protein
MWQSLAARLLGSFSGDQREIEKLARDLRVNASALVRRLGALEPIDPDQQECVQRIFGLF